MSWTQNEAKAVAAACRVTGRTQGAHTTVMAEAKAEKCVGMDSAFAVVVVRVTWSATVREDKRTVCFTEAEAMAAAHGDVVTPSVTVDVAVTDRTRNDAGAFNTHRHRVVVPNNNDDPTLVAAQIVAATHPDGMVLATTVAE